MSEFIDNGPVLPVEEPVPTPVVEEKIYTYQPTDEEGRAIGGKQVIKYTTHEELADKLKEQSILLIRKLRSETRKNRLGIVEDEQIEDTATRHIEPVSFTPIELSSDEYVELSRDLTDPARAAGAQKRLFEASVGATPDKVGQVLRELQEDNIVLKARLESEAFKSDNPDYLACKENSDAITGWIVRYGLAPTKENFQRAYKTLREQGILLEKPENVHRQEVREVIAQPEPVIVQDREPIEQPQQEYQRLPSGFTRDTTSDSGAQRQLGDEITFVLERDGHKTVYTGLAALNAMPSEEYKKRLIHDPNFARIADKLESEAEKRRNPWR